MVKLAISDISLKEGDKLGSTTAKLTLILDKPAIEEVTVEVSTEEGTAFDGEDYEGLDSTTVIFPVGSTKQTISIPIISDSIFEENENFTVHLDNVEGAELEQAEATVEIINDDKPILSIVNAVTITEGEKGNANAEILVSLSAPVSESVTVNYKTGNGATAKSTGTTADFTATQGKLTFKPGETTQKILVPILDDKLSEQDENFTVKLSGPKGAVLDSNSSAIVTIKDNDGGTNNVITTGKPTISVNAPTKVFEDSEAQITVLLSQPSTKTVTVKYTTTNGTAKGDDDFGITSGTLTFKAGETQKSVAVSIFQDDIKEKAENFSFQLSNPREATLSGQSSAKITINDVGSFSESSAMLIDLVGMTTPTLSENSTAF